MISVVMSTYNRGRFLENSLAGYHRAKLNVPLELVIVDDGSEDMTDHLVKSWQYLLNIVYIRLVKPKGLWRDCAMTINTGIRAARGEVVIATHPEVIPGVNSLQDLWDHRAERTYLCNKVYYLTPENQAALHSVDWRTSNLAVRNLPDFYAGASAELRSHPDYTHEATDRHTEWGSWVFGGMTKMGWRWIGGFNESPNWGTVDVDFKIRRDFLEVPSYTSMDPETIVIHQNHDAPLAGDKSWVATPRDMDKALAALPTYHSHNEARLGLI